MESLADTVAVVFDGAWKIKFRENHFGPYPSKRAAVSQAATWVANAHKGGRRLVLVINGSAVAREPSAWLDSVS
jgi:hypothetical protein